MSVVNIALHIVRKLLKIVLEFSLQGEVCFFFFLSFFLHSFYGFSEKMDVSQTYHGNHFTKYVNQASMLYVLDLHSDNETHY